MPDHRCDERTIDYSTVEDRYLICGVCYRRWDLDPVRGWIMHPREAAPSRPRTSA